MKYFIKKGIWVFCILFFMSGPGCSPRVNRIEYVIEKSPGKSSVDSLKSYLIDLKGMNLVKLSGNNDKLFVEYDRFKTSDKAIKSEIIRAGFTPVSENKTRVYK